MSRLLFFIAIGIFSDLFSQIEPRYSQFNFTRALLNPGALAHEAPASAEFVYRNQWTGIDGAPVTFGMNGGYELNSDMAVGINVYSDRIGLNQMNSFSAVYAYRLNFNPKHYVGFGIGLGFDNFSSNLTQATTIMPNDPTFATNISSFRFNTSLGAYYKKNDKIYAGISIPKLMQPYKTVGTATLAPSKWVVLAMAGYKWQINNSLSIDPNVLVKAMVNTPIQADLLVRFDLNAIGFSVGYRTEKSLIAGFDLKIRNMLRLGYTVNHDIGSLARSKGLSHELHLGIGWPFYNREENFNDRKIFSKKGKYQTDYKGEYKRSTKE